MCLRGDMAPIQSLSVGASSFFEVINFAIVFFVVEAIKETSVLISVQAV